MVKNGGHTSIFTSQGSSSLSSGEACTRVGSTSEFYITDRDKSWWDPAHVPTVYVGGVETVPADIDYAAGMITLSSYTSGAVTVDCYHYTPEWLGGGYGFDINPKTDKKDVTVFPSVLNTATAWRKYIATLKDWTATVSRHYWYGRAWTLLDCTNGNSDLLWTWRSYGTPGNLEQVEYIVSGLDTALEITRAGHKTTVTVATDGSGNPTSTAAQIKAHVEADSTLTALWEVEYSGVQTGAGIVNAKSVQTCTSGRDHSSDIARLGTKILVRFYLDVATASQEILSGVAHVEAVPLDAKLDSLIEADLTLQGEGRLKYHTV